MFVIALLSCQEKLQLTVILVWVMMWKWRWVCEVEHVVVLVVYPLSLPLDMLEKWTDEA